ncbi:hypothetical protein BKA69DRAFT_1169447 [Paraphysoderma sedebokerense]|nr:hypothetical protein BKA69DRAFT_1169447 [Paraphysoderma sedebokerense]
MSTLVIITILCMLSSHAFAQLVTVPNLLGNSTGECFATISSFRGSQCISQLASPFQPNATLDQYLKLIISITDNVCSPQCAEESKRAVDTARQKCTGVVDKALLYTANSLAFGRTMSCMKSLDGTYCHTKLLEGLRGQNITYPELLRYLNNRQSAIPSLENLPKNMICSDCFKKYEEQTAAYAFSMATDTTINLPGWNRTESIINSMKSIRSIYVTKINQQCGANHLADNPVLNLAADAPVTTSSASNDSSKFTVIFVVALSALLWL